MEQHDNKKEAMWRERKKTGAIYLKAINRSCCHFFSWATHKHASYFKTFSAAVPATRMTEHDVKAAHTDSSRESIIRKCESVVWKSQQS